jgi:hypothetical protein
VNCPGCDRRLRPHEFAQPINILGQERRVASYCDACCYAAKTMPGSASSLERLIRGEVDAEESARIAEVLGR